MKGLILAGGTGSRLAPMTKITNKHLLPVAGNFMIAYPLKVLIDAGIKKIMIVTGKENCGDFMKVLGSGSEFGCEFTFKIQDEAGGIAQALGLAKDFVGDDNVTVILGDNFFEEDLREEVKAFTKGAKIFLKEVEDPHRFGVAEIKDNKVLSIEEKPKDPKSNLAVTGIYIFDSVVFEVIKTLKPSDRGELEVTDVNNWYVKQGNMQYCILKGFWSDMGTHESMHKASFFIQGKK